MILRFALRKVSLLQAQLELVICLGCHLAHIKEGKLPLSSARVNDVPGGCLSTHLEEVARDRQRKRVVMPVLGDSSPSRPSINKVWRLEHSPCARAIPPLPATQVETWVLLCRKKKCLGVSRATRFLRVQADLKTYVLEHLEEIVEDLLCFLFPIIYLHPGSLHREEEQGETGEGDAATVRHRGVNAAAIVDLLNLPEIPALSLLPSLRRRGPFCHRNALPRREKGEQGHHCRSCCRSSIVR
nr:hypothetical protein Iba_chr10bCG7590 [Ipomoea batatas]